MSNTDGIEHMSPDFEAAKGWIDEEAYFRTGQYLPNNPVRKRLRRYIADLRSQRAGSTCTKYQYRHRGLTPRVIIFFCLKCGKCIGFVVMRNAESPRVPFEVLFTRWSKAPKVFCYDNGCNSHVYILNREPQWAQSLKVVIDGLHEPNHKDCSKAYAIKRYAELASRNSVVYEQRN